MTDSLIERASQLIELSRYAEAEKYVKEMLTLDPSNVEAVVLLAVCKSEQGQYDKAIELIRQAISQQPDNDYHLYLHALFSFRKEVFKEAKKFIDNAISFNPLHADYFGLLASININQKDWQFALENANKGLSLDSENLTCLNLRSTALFKLDKKEEAYSTIQEALNQDPENDYTHTNVGWGQLEKGDHKKALEHFREALKLNPENESAKAGLVEGLKARNLFYRLFLKYAFWISNLKGKLQWVVILGFYFGSRFLNTLANRNPSLEPFIKPIVIAYTLFALSTWVIAPLSNLFLRLNVYGRYALTKDEVKSSNLVAVSFTIGLIGVALYLFKSLDLYFMIAFFGITMMIPLSSIFRPIKKSSKNILSSYAIGLVVVGAITILLQATTGNAGIFPVIYFFG
ncbi:MAG: tetratricopeptide repeat protein, partial [Flammeovirgaceae bacterium]